MNTDFPWQGAFVLDNFRSLRFPVQVEATTRYMFLTRQVQRWPSALSFHVCRIDSAIAMNNHQAIDGAVLDLFYVLEDKGHGFRQRILSKANKHLSQEMSAALQQVLSGQICSSELPFSARSVLHDGFDSAEKGLLFDKATSSQQTVELDVVNIARLCLESGQIEQAQEMLEEQLKIEPERTDIRRDLLEIYCATKDQINFHNSYQLLQTRGYLDTSWNDAVSLFTTTMNEHL